MAPRLSHARLIADEALELACLADEVATRPTAYAPCLTAGEQREVARFVKLSRALVRQGVVVQLALAPYLPQVIEEAA